MPPPVHGQQPGRPTPTTDHLAPADAGSHGSITAKHRIQQDADQEGGQGHTGQGQGHQALWRPRTRGARRQTPRAAPPQHGQQRGHHGEFERGGHALGEQLGDGPPLPKAHPEVALHGAGDEPRELHRHGPVEAQFLAKGFPLRRRRLHPSICARGSPTNWKRRNANSATVNRTAAPCRRRRIRKASIAGMIGRAMPWPTPKKPPEGRLCTLRPVAGRSQRPLRSCAGCRGRSPVFPCGWAGGRCEPSPCCRVRHRRRASAPRQVVVVPRPTRWCDLGGAHLQARVPSLMSPVPTAMLAPTRKLLTLRLVLVSPLPVPRTAWPARR